MNARTLPRPADRSGGAAAAALDHRLVAVMRAIPRESTLSWPWHSNYIPFREPNPAGPDIVGLAPVAAPARRVRPAAPATGGVGLDPRLAGLRALRHDRRGVRA